MLKVSDERRKNYAARVEKLLVVSWNTIRLTDYPIAKFVDAQLDMDTPDEVIKLMIIDRRTPYFRYRGLSEESYYKTIGLVYPDAYYTAPETLLYPILYSAAFQSVNEIVIAHHTFMDSIDISSMVEPHLLNIGFNGTIEHLEELLINYKSTGLVIDDIEFLKEIIERKNINIDGMTFIIPMLGYNFVKTPDGMDYKYREIIDTAMQEKEFDLAFVDLFILSREKLEEYVGGNKDVAGN